MIVIGTAVPGRASAQGAEEAGTFIWIPAGVFSRPTFMITKESRSMAQVSLHQKQSLLDHAMRLRLFTR
jgi:hypothetical protein